MNNKPVDVNLIGTTYSVSDPSGKIVKTIQIVTMDDFIDAGLEEFSSNFTDMEDYLKKSIISFTGFDNTSPTKILWYSTQDEELSVSEILEYAIVFDYDKVILEHLEELN